MNELNNTFGTDPTRNFSQRLEDVGFKTLVRVNASNALTSPTDDELVAANPALSSSSGSSPFVLKSANGYTAAAGNRIQADTSSGAFSITLPATATAMDEIQVEDATLSWDSANLTLLRNGLKINSGTSDYTANVIGGKLSIVYINATVGWSIK